MNKSTGMLLTCLGLLAASVIAGWSDAQAIVTTNAAIAELDRQIATADQASREAAARIGAAAAELRSIAAAPAEPARAQPPSDAAARTAASAAAIEWAKRWEQQQQDPKIQNENLAIARARLHDKFAPLYRSLHLTPSQIAAFEENEAVHQAKQSDLSAALQEQHIAVMDPIAQQLYGKLANEEQSAQRALLGESGYAALHEFQRTERVRELVGAVAGATTAMGNPLNPDQSEQLVRVLAESDPGYLSGGSAGMEISWDRALTTAQPILSPTQWDVFRNMEPPGGGRYWTILNAAVGHALKSELKPASRGKSGSR